jgi:D-sedoheptulose 7-phosphate isomerase
MTNDGFDAASLLRGEIAEHVAVARATSEELSEPFGRLVDMALACLRSGGKLIFFGNGGSAADAQHWATELTVRFRGNRRAIPALALTTDSSALTAIGNDLGFNLVFARQLEALARSGDCVVGISTSGKSPNVIAALEMARMMGCRTAAFTGYGGGALAEIVEVVLLVPSMDTARIQEMHAVLGHALCAAIEGSHASG